MNILSDGLYVCHGRTFQVRTFGNHISVFLDGSKYGFYGFTEAKNCRKSTNYLMTGRQVDGSPITRVFILGRFAFDSTMRAAA